MAALPPNMTDAWKPLIFKAFRASFTLVAARYIGPADAAELRGLFLGHGGRAVQTVAQTDNLCLTSCQGRLDAFFQFFAQLRVADPLGHVILLGHHVHDGQAAAVPVHIQRVRQAHIPRRLLPAAKVHQYLVRYPLPTDT